MEKIDIEKAKFFTKVIGSLALLKPFMEKMGIREIIDRTCPADPQKLLSHGVVIELMGANRLLSPSPLYAVEDWAYQSGVEEVYKIDPALLNDDRLGDILDAIHEYIPVLKGEISLEVAKRFQIGLEHIHWDLTSFHFEGDYENQEEQYIKIVYAKTKKSEMARKSAKIGINIANDGKGPVPIFYESLDGNATGFEATIENMENLKKHLKLDRLIRINDRGCFREKIVAKTRRMGFYLISSIAWSPTYESILKKELSEGKKFEGLSYLSLNQARKKNPSERDGYEALEVPYDFSYGGRSYRFRLIFIKSDGKIKRDQKARLKHIDRLQTQLEELKGKVGQPYYRDIQKVEQKVSKILGIYKEGEFFYTQFIADSEGNLKFNYGLDNKKIKEAEELDGIYLIGTTVGDEEYPVDKIFTLFKQQHYSESANKYLKSHIRIRPMFLQTQRRIESLLFVLFLALMVYMLIERVYRTNIKIEEKKKRTTTQTLLNTFRHYCMTIVKQGTEVQAIPNEFSSLQQEICQTLGIIPWCRDP